MIISRCLFNFAPTSPMMVWYKFLLLVTILTHGVKCQVAYSRTVQCNQDSTSSQEDMALIKIWAARLPTDMNKEITNHFKGYFGTVAVIGTGTEKQGALYFTAMAALRTGADKVVVFCYSRSEVIMKSFGPDLIVHAFLDTTVDVMIATLEKVDMVILGPGLDNSAHSTVHVIPKTILHCKTHKKPLVLDLRQDLYTAATMALLKDFPKPGVILTPNRQEFQALYEIIKIAGTASDVDLKINYRDYGSNFFILRKDCYDVGISPDPRTSWVSSERGGMKRSTGQGNILAGVLGTYYMWADKILPKNVTDQHGEMFSASVAAYLASKTTRQACHRGVNSYSRGMMTSDMLLSLPDAINSYEL